MAGQGPDLTSSPRFRLSSFPRITPPLCPSKSDPSLSPLQHLPTLGLEGALLAPEGFPRRSGLQQAQIALISDLWCLNLPLPHGHYNLSTRDTEPQSRVEIDRRASRGCLN